MKNALKTIYHWENESHKSIHNTATGMADIFLKFAMSRIYSRALGTLICTVVEFLAKLRAHLMYNIAVVPRVYQER